ncbi:hypothetical protein [Paraburkholderia sp. JHI869]|uniref:hypothetical protein n=1 Tax=Paraburkholderia sp. JHI869 TaxID=3112959 RepID=UPI00316D7411
MPEPIAYVIAFEKNRRTTYHGSAVDERAALRFYLSPFDAVLDIVRRPEECVGQDASISVRPVDAFHLGAIKVLGGQPQAHVQRSMNK